MAVLGSIASGLSKLLRRECGIAAIAVRNESTEKTEKKIMSGMDPNKWLDCRMKRDVKRRKMVKEHATTRVRLMAMKRNDILPPEIQELACQLMDETPRQSSIRQVTFRCKLTSRPRGVVYRWGVSRIMFRHLADYNQLGGVQRAMW